MIFRLNLRATYVPAFFHTFISEKSKQIGCVQYNDALIGHLLAVETQVPPKHLPMLVQPRPWITWKSGGYLTDVMKTDMARIGKHPQHRQYMDAADQSGHLGTLFHALDCLGSTGWRMNVKVLEVTLKKTIV